MKKLLVVEDEIGLAFILQKTIKRDEYRIVDMVFNGQAAIAAAKKHRPDVILMDIRIRGPLDGVDAAMEIRRFSDAPIIYLTAFLDPVNEARVQQTAHSTCLVKPVTAQQLNAHIRSVLEPAPRASVTKIVEDALDEYHTANDVS